MEVKNFRYVSKCCATCKYHKIGVCIKNDHPFKLEYPSNTICDEFEFDNIEN